MIDAAESDQKLKNLFHRYYVEEDLDPPDLLPSREIGYIPFSGTMSRHRRIQSARDLKYFVSNAVPRHLYYSTSYYRKPDEKKMQDKEWLGAELIFDLDADHIKGADTMTYVQILAEVKKHTLRLIDDFLMSDLGIQESEIKLFFSGGRGYHVHVISDKVYDLNSDSRREITDFIRGENLTSQGMIASINRTQLLGGWPKRIDSFVSDFFRVLPRERTEAMEQLKRVFPSANTARSFFDHIMKPSRIGSKTMNRIDILSLNGIEKYRILSEDERGIAMLGWLIERARENMSAEIDDPVTTDVHRLIRFPGSLHGKTGLKVLGLKISDLPSFDPLVSAIPETFRNGNAKIYAEKEGTIDINGQTIRVAEGEQEVPLYAAIFLSASRRAYLI